MEDKNRLNACLYLKFDDIWLLLNIQMIKIGKRSRIISTDFKKRGTAFRNRREQESALIINYI